MARQRLFQERLTEGELCPLVTAYYFKQWNGYSMDFHTHPSSEVMYVISGSCSVELMARGTRAAVMLTKGEFILLDANVPHRLVVEDTCRMLNVEFRFAEKTGPYPSIRELAAVNPALDRLIQYEEAYIVLREPQDIFYLLRSLAMELDRGGLDSESMVQLLMGQLLIRISRLYEEASTQGADPYGAYIKRAVEYIRHNYDRAITVEDVAGAVNLHPGYLQRIFKRVTSQTLVEYITDYRMEKAKMLLVHTDIPVAEIADYVGVGSRQYFHQLFKKHSRMTPVAYRISFMSEQRNMDLISEDF